MTDRPGTSVPCSTCPWRRGSDPNLIPNFNLEQAHGLLACGAGEDNFKTIFACHHSTEGENDYACIGYVGSEEGFSNLAVRMMAARGEIKLPDIWEARERLDLYDTWSEALANIEDRWEEPR